MNFLVDDEYLRFIDGIKEQLKNAQYKVLMNANYEQIILYWNIGQDLLLNDKWGSKFIDILAKDIKSSMPDLKGYSARNLRYINLRLKLAILNFCRQCLQNCHGLTISSY